MEDLIKVKDAEIAKLLAGNREIADELRQCQADKEFVWSLWKRLQVSSPDLTQAISIVLQREKEKAETKDRKVLEILQGKDELIRDLQETARCLEADKDRLLELKVAAEGTANKQAQECQKLQAEISVLKQNSDISNVSKDQKIQGIQDALKDSEVQQAQLNEQVTSLLREMQQMRENLEKTKDEKSSEEQKAKRLEEEIQDKDAVLTRLTNEKSRLSDEISQFKGERDRIKQLKESCKKHEAKHKELRDSYEQLKSHCHQQKQLILQLQELHKSTQKVLTEQQEASKNGTTGLQSMYNEIAREYQQVKQENSDLKQRLLEQEEAIHSTEKELRKSIEMASRRERIYDYGDLEDQLASQQKEIERLRSKIKDNSRRRSDSPYGQDQTFSPIVERGVQQNAVRSRSYSPVRQSKQLATTQKRLKATETKLEETKRLLDLKRDEVNEIQQAHNRRLERLRSLQSDYKLLKSSSSDKHHRSSSPRKKRSNFAPPSSRLDRRDLRQETSETVWNDLVYYKQQNKNLAQDKWSLEEELDNLRVQATVDRATIQDLNMCLKNEKNELMARLRSSARADERRSSTPKKGKSLSPRPTRRVVKNLERRLENAAEDNRLLKKDRDRMQEDNRTLKSDIKSLKREIADTRHSGTTLRQQNSDLRVKLQSQDGDMARLSGEAAALKTEVQGLRTDNAGVRSENASLRSENSDLRQDLSDLKREIGELQDELRHASRPVTSPESRQSLKAHRKTKGAISAAKKHQKFLNKSIGEMRDAFGDHFDARDLDPVSTTTMSGEEEEDEDTTATFAENEIGRSDASSLGQSIVRASRRGKGFLRDEDADEDETMVDAPLHTAGGSRKNGKAPVRRVMSRQGQGAMTSLKHRLASLQTQCQSLRAAKQNGLKRLNDEKEKTEELQNELVSCQNKLKSSKQQIQRLSREAEVSLRERDEMQKDLEEARSSHPEPQKHSDADYKYIDSKLKMANSESVRLNEQVKDLKREIEAKSEQAAVDKERINRLERDVTAKRQLIEEMRAKVRENEQRDKADRQGQIELEERMRAAEEDLLHKKSHVESLRRQLQAATKEKARYETMYNKSREELDKRCGEMTSLQARKMEAESVTSQVEQAAEKQLQTLASRSEQALDKLKAKLERCEERIGEFNTFVKSLCGNLLDLIQRQRDSFFKEKSSRLETSDVTDPSAPSSLSRAQTVACNILNISKSDFEDLMAPVDSVRRRRQEERGGWEEEKILASKSDQSWRNKVEKIASENPPFAKSLCRLLWDKMQDAVKLTEDKWRLQTEHLEQQLVKKT